MHAPRSCSRDEHQRRQCEGAATPSPSPRRPDGGSEPMKARRVAAFVESLRRNRQPKPFEPGPDDIEAMRAAIELNNAQPGAALPSGEFVSDLHRRLAEQLDEGGATVDALANRVSRRRMLGTI